MHVDVNSYEDIGQYLREVREDMGLDTRDIGQRLNIRAKYLDALEAGDIHVMPGKVYARGYLQHYAEFLGLDKEEIAEAFDRMHEGGKPRYFVPEPTNRGYQPGLLLVGVALVVVMVLYYQWYKNHKVTEPPAYERVSPVPERLMDPIVNEPAMQQNDDLYSTPYSEGAVRQGDENYTPPADGPVATDMPAEGAADAAVTPATEGQESAPAEAAASAEPQAATPAEPAAEAAAPAKPKKAKLPWLKKEKQP